MTQPRRWFQLHLSTAVAILLVVGGILGANVLPHYDRIRLDSWSDAPVSVEEAMQVNRQVQQDYGWSHYSYIRVRRYGWPLSICWHSERVYAKDFKWIEEPDRTVFEFDYQGELHLAANTAIWIFAIILTAAMCETVCRRAKS